MKRTIAFCIGLALAWCGTAEAQLLLPDPTLCIKGHPAKRSENVTYGGLRARHGYQRDHYISLGLGGPDIISNVHYQRCDLTGSFGRCIAGPAHDKDNDEHYAEEQQCSGRWPTSYAQQWLVHRWPLDAEHGFGQ